MDAVFPMDFISKDDELTVQADVDHISFMVFDEFYRQVDLVPPESTFNFVELEVSSQFSVTEKSSYLRVHLDPQSKFSQSRSNYERVLNLEIGELPPRFGLLLVVHFFLFS
jgi:hypothetical protein